MRQEKKYKKQRKRINWRLSVSWLTSLLYLTEGVLSGPDKLKSSPDQFLTTDMLF